jgi:citrate lyase subunit beta/citryl-CoA lyase
LGWYDLAADLGADPTDAPALMAHASSMLIIASRVSRRPQPLGAPWIAFRDLAGLQTAATAARRAGFGGMLAIHPHQVEPINLAFTPEPEEIARARRVIEAADAGARRGEGAVELDGVMIDEAIVRSARVILDRSTASWAPTSPGEDDTEMPR